MAKSERRGLFALRVVGVSAALTLLVWLFRSVNLEHVQGLLAGVGPAGLLLIAIPAGATALFECIAWRRVFLVWGQAVGLWPLLRVRVATEALSQTLPLGALWSESIKPALLSRHGQVPTSRGIAGAVARRYLLVSSQVPYALLSAVLGVSALRAISLHILDNCWLLLLPWLAVALLLLTALGVAGALAKGRLAARLHAALSLLPNARLRAFLGRTQHQFTRSDDLVERYFAEPFRVSTLSPGFWVFLGWMCEAVEAAIILRLIGVRLDFASVLAIEGCIAFLRNLAIVLPGGFGVQELGYAACLAALGVPDALNASAAFSILRRAKELAWASVGYGLLLWDLRGAAPRWTPEPVRKTA